MGGIFLRERSADASAAAWVSAPSEDGGAIGHRIRSESLEFA
jgi:hypothetical protein